MSSFFLEEQLIKGRSDLDFISDCDELISIDLDSSLKVDSVKYNKKIDYKFHDNKIQIKKPDFKANNFSISLFIIMDSPKKQSMHHGTEELFGQKIHMVIIGQVLLVK